MRAFCLRNMHITRLRIFSSSCEFHWKSLQRGFYRHTESMPCKRTFTACPNVLIYNIRPRYFSSKNFNDVTVRPTSNVRLDVTSARDRNLSHCVMVKRIRHFSSRSGGDVSSKAWQIGKYDGNDSFQLVDVQRPEITKPNEVLIKVHAASVNPIDVKTRNGYGATLLNKARRVKPGDEFPLVLGRDCSGVVVAVGKGVKDIKVGDNVWATVNAAKQGSHAEYVLATTDELSLKPENLSHVEAASIPYVAITNWSAIYAVAKFRAANALGKRALILGGSGGIGTFGIQLLNAWGANVTVTCNPNAFDLVYELGAHNAVSYNSPYLVKELLAHGKYDFILNAVNDSWEDIAIKVIKEKAYAQYVTLVTSFMNDIDKKGAIMGGLASSLALFKKSRRFAAVGGTYRWAFAQSNSFALKEVAKLVEEGKIRPVIDEVFAFKELTSAFEKVEEGHSRGKVVVKMAEASAENMGDNSTPQLFE